MTFRNSSNSSRPDIAKKYRRPVWRPDAETLRDFCEFEWPGNIRQLSHVIEQSYVLDSSPILPRAAAIAVLLRSLFQSGPLTQ